MILFVEKIKSYEDYTELGGVSEDAIKKAEDTLGLRFAEEYRKYLAECGIASADGHEFTGIGKSKRLDVVAVTLNGRNKNLYVLDNMYVIEQIGIDGLTVWQDSEGNVYQSKDCGEISKISDTLVGYL